MRRRSETATPSRIVDYSAARAEAIKRLGDRYLLAKPINAARSPRSSKEPAPAPTNDH